MSTQALQKLRIVAIPLTRPASATSSSKLTRLTYYQFQLFKEKGKQRATETHTSAGWRAWPAQIRQAGIVEWTTQKATHAWASFGRAPGGWRLRVHTMGERLVDRIDFEELALKSIDPRLGPHILKLSREEPEKPPKIPLIYPSSQLTSEESLEELRAYSLHRIPRHRRGMYIWAIVAPLTAPFMLIPIIPNLPFFFCVWRSWSHYRAYKASQYLGLLLQHNVLLPEPSSSLDALYKLPKGGNVPQLPPITPSRSPDSNSTPPGASSPPPKADSDKNELLLTRSAVPTLLEILQVSSESTTAVDVYRAIDQARIRVQSGKLRL